MDTDPATSNPFSSTAGGAISQPSVKIDTPSSAAGARTNYVIAFTTSANGGGMSNAAGSKVAFTLPGDAGLSAFRGAILYDVSQTKNVGTCDESSCGFYSGSSSAAGDQLEIRLYGVT